MKKPLRLEHTFACDEDWDAMPGNAKRRHCSECDRHLLNLSEFTERQAHSLATQMAEKGEFCAVFDLDGDRILFQPEPPSRIPRFVTAAALTLPLMAACEDAPRATAVPGDATVNVAGPNVQVEAIETVETQGAAALPRDGEEFVACSDEELAEMKEKRNSQQIEARSKLFEILEGGEVVEAALEDTVITGTKNPTIEEIQAQRQRGRKLMGKIRAPDLVIRERDGVQILD